METKPAFLLSIAITLLISLNYFYFSQTLNENPREEVIIKSIIDGDTLTLEDGRVLRLLNINAPEKSEFFYELSFNYLKKLENQTVEIEPVSLGKYKRTLSRMYSLDGKYINLDLVQKGLVIKSMVNEKELSIFSQAEEQAIQNEEGMWKKSYLFSCFEVNINKEDEYVHLTNKCNTENMVNWILKDESTKKYVFPEITSNNLIIHTSSGEDNETDLFWNLETNVWNNDRDSLYLFDSQGGLVHYEAYGY